MESLDIYMSKVAQALARSVPDKAEGLYTDLAAAETFTQEKPGADAGTPPDNLVSFQEIMMVEIANCNLDKIQLGINELLKHFLKTISRDREQYMAEQYLYRLRMIFKRCLLPDFPFAEEIWNYICACLRSTGSHLLEQEYYAAVREIIDSLSGMGRIAALHGLPTANTQSSLRILENKALEKNEKQLASVAKNARFNLET